ncbi:hypothetical protein LIER_20361 [Lithospermum erythrorhizon]|uniref:DUF4005 domain-containing protein n=1 Tax=Lithospermum erythrorhizon TaxID=34254 RepID=A0AAV3QMA2_LITER
MSSSCFKIISCGNKDSFDNDEDHIEPSPQGKDKRGWSFRKRSARHRVLSNTVNSETASANKASPVSAALDFQCQPISDVPEKVPAVVFTEEKSKLSTPVSSKLSETLAANANETNADAKPDELDVKPNEPKTNPDEPDVKPNEPKANPDEPDANPHEPHADSNLDESVVIVIQSAVRAFLAQKVLLENKNIIKLQAAVRGHLERRHAVGTLRCVQAIIKMQVLVRARQARMLPEESIAVEGHRKGKENARTLPHVTYTSIEKLLSNRFAQQLMDSTPRTKSINIKCDPSKSDSAWKWLERWVAVSPTEDQPPLGTAAEHEKNKEQAPTQESASLIPDEEEIGIVTEEDTVVLHDKKKDAHTDIEEQTSVQHEKEMEDFVPQEQMAVPSESNCKPEFNFNSEVSESDPKLIMHDENGLGGIQAHEATSTLSNNLEQLETHNTVNTKSEHSNSVSDDNKELELPGTGELNVDAETETRCEQTFESQERSAIENSETEGEKLITGSRKANNPNFLAAQSKFEELSSVSNLTKSLSSTTQTAEDETYVDAESKFKELSSVASLTKSISSINQTAEDGSYLDALSSFTDRTSRKESVPVEDLTSSSSNIQLGNSDTSEVQLGSDTSKIQLGGSECGTELSITSTLDSPERSDVGPGEFDLGGKVSEDMNHKDGLVVEAKTEPTIINASIVDSDAIQPERYDSSLKTNDDHSASSVTVEVPKIEQKPETDVSKLQLEMEPEKRNSISKSSPEASPRTHATAPEPQGTPSSEVSGKPKRTKSEKSVSNHKLRSSSAGKTSPSNLNHGSEGRSTVEKSNKDHKSVKRRNSFGSPKPDHVDQEPRDSSSSNPLPSYMQPTESAKAKALLNSSPRSSPDVLDKDVSLKKRHSLPGGNGSQGSPQIQRTLSEVPRTEKGSESQSQQGILRSTSAIVG